MIENHFAPHAKIRYNNGIYQKYTDKYGKNREILVTNGVRKPLTVLCARSEDSLDLLAWENTLYGKTDAAQRYLRCAQEASTAYVQCIINHNREFRIAHDGLVLPVTGAFDNNMWGNRWLQAFYLAMIQRNRRAIAVLSQVPTGILDANNVGERKKKFNHALIDLYKAMFDPAANFAEHMVRTTAAFDPNNYADWAFEYVSHLTWPQVAIIRTIFTRGQEAEFNREMEKALLLHKEYWDKEEDYRNGKTDGALPLALIALVVLARDHASYRLTVENGYIPEWMLEPQPIPEDVQATYDEINAQPLEEPAFPVPGFVLKSLSNGDFDTLEGLRERDHAAYVPQLVALYEENDDWGLRERIVYMLQDCRNDNRLKPMMERALHSPHIPMQGIALVWLLGPETWDEILDGGRIDETKTVPLVAAYLKEQGM